MDNAEEHNTDGQRPADLTQVTDRARSAFIWLFSTTIVWQLLSWGLTFVTARLLRPADYGLMNLTETVFPYLFMITTLRLDSWLVQTKDFTEERQETIFTLLLALSVITGTIAFFAASWIADFYNEPRVLDPFRMFAILFPLRALQVIPDVRLRRELNLKPIAIANLTIGLSRGILQVTLAYYGYEYWSLVYGQLFGDIALTCWLIWRSGLPKRLRWDKSIAHTAVAFGLAATGATVFGVISSTSDNLIVGKLFGIEMLGFYTMAFFLTELPVSKFNTVVSPILTPLYARLKSDPAFVTSAYLKTISLSATVVAPVLIGMAAVADQAIPLVLGEKWAPMVVPFRVFCGVAILRALTSTASSLLFALNRPRDVLFYSAMQAVIMPLSFLTGAYFGGVNGVLLAWVLVYPLVGTSVILRAVNRAAAITPAAYLRAAQAAVLSAVLMGGVVYGAVFVLSGRLSASLVLAAGIVVGAITYCGAHYLLFPEQTRSVLDLARRRKV